MKKAESTEISYKKPDSIKNPVFCTLISLSFADK